MDERGWKMVRHAWMPTRVSDWFVSARSPVYRHMLMVVVCVQTAHPMCLVALLVWLHRAPSWVDSAVAQPLVLTAVMDQLDAMLTRGIPMRRHVLRDRRSHSHDIPHGAIVCVPS